MWGIKNEKMCTKKSLLQLVTGRKFGRECTHANPDFDRGDKKREESVFFVALLFPCALHDRKIIRPRGGCPCVIGAVERQWLIIENVFCSLFSIVNVLGF